mmetsp:Transcript_14516/g.24781  ORF Transcript_14516/g.24781 Transcript_14516/m.24781 type:complete len:141 (+) Transcript_14516:746-1168(+)
MEAWPSPSPCEVDQEPALFKLSAENEDPENENLSFKPLYFDLYPKGGIDRYYQYKLAGYNQFISSQGEEEAQQEDEVAENEECSFVSMGSDDYRSIEKNLEKEILNDDHSSDGGNLDHFNGAQALQTEIIFPHIDHRRGR